MTYQASVVNGVIHLPAEVHLPDNTKVLVVVPQQQQTVLHRIMSPRLANPDDLIDFQMEVRELTDAGV